jgi:arginyl-tRNA synthetase
MDSIKSMLTGIFSRAFTQCGCEPISGVVVDSQRPDLGQFQCNGALAASKALKRNPRALAEEVVAIAKQDPCIRELSIAGPGFINITLNDDFIGNCCSTLQNDPRIGYAQPDVNSRKTVVIDFGGPNVAKPMHVGHLRSAIIGDSLQRICRFVGDTVISDNHLGDWGTQMGMLIRELKKRQPLLPYFKDPLPESFPVEAPVTIADLEEMYPKASAECKSDPAALAEAVEATSQLQQGHPGYIALWSHFCSLSIAEMRRDFDTLGVCFDHWLGESSYRDRMQAMVRRLASQGLAQQSNGALVIPVALPDDPKEVPPLMLEKSGGGFLYGTSDLATIEYRVEKFNPHEILYVVDKRQGLHFEQLFRAARSTGIAPAATIFAHVGFGTVNGADGKPFKTRAGGVMKLKDLFTLVNDQALLRMDEAGVAREFNDLEKAGVAQTVGLAALKFADLMNHRESDYLFDIDKFTRFEGKTGPYILYTAVRIKSILRNVAEKNLAAGAIAPATTAGERDLMLMLTRLPEVIRSARESYLPNYLCDFCYNLAQEFNRFYRDCHILNEKDSAKQASWIAVIKLVLAEFELLLGLLGIAIPERM